MEYTIKWKFRRWDWLTALKLDLGTVSLEPLSSPTATLIEGRRHGCLAKPRPFGGITYIVGCNVSHVLCLDLFKYLYTYPPLCPGTPSRYSSHDQELEELCVQDLKLFHARAVWPHTLIGNPSCFTQLSRNVLLASLTFGLLAHVIMPSNCCFY